MLWAAMLFFAITSNISWSFKFFSALACMDLISRTVGLGGVFFAGEWILWASPFVLTVLATVIWVAFLNIKSSREDAPLI